MQTKACSMRSMGLLAGAIFFALTGAGCLDIEKQTILVVFPKVGKEILDACLGKDGFTRPVSTGQPILELFG